MRLCCESKRRENGDEFPREGGAFGAGCPASPRSCLSRRVLMVLLLVLWTDGAWAGRLEHESSLGRLSYLFLVVDVVVVLQVSLLKLYISRLRER